jgi:glycosyltransferase involved in cell wall biosynthesis
MAEPRVTLLVPTLQPRDAVGNDVMGMKECLERAGYAVTVGAQYVHSEYRKSTLTLTTETTLDAGAPGDILIYHHAIDWELGEKILARNRRKLVLKYHNLTPAHFYAGYSENYRVACERGRAASTRLAALPGAWIWGDSQYNSAEFLALGAEPARMRVIPPFHHIEDLQRSPLDAVVTGAFRSMGPNVLFVGAFRPNKGHAKALEVFSAMLQKTGRPGYLLLVGSLDPALSQYVEDILDYSRRLGVDEFVHFATSVNSMQLRAFYHVSDVFLCVSEHEGFCVPLAEAMALRVPIVAWRECAVGETLGDAGIGFDTYDPRAIAQAVEDLAVSPLTASAWADRGRLRYEQRFAPPRIEETFLACFAEVAAR